jgi:hypothetical protein
MLCCVISIFTCAICFSQAHLLFTFIHRQNGFFMLESDFALIAIQDVSSYFKGQLPLYLGQCVYFGEYTNDKFHER